MRQSHELSAQRRQATHPACELWWWSGLAGLAGLLTVWLPSSRRLQKYGKQNSPGLGPVACQITSIEFCYQPFPFFRIVFETFAIEANSISNCFRNFCNRIEANSSSHFRAIFRFDFEFQSTQTWTQIRATTRARAEIEHEFEPQFELELKSNRIESS